MPDPTCWDGELLTPQPNALYFRQDDPSERKRPPGRCLRGRRLGRPVAAHAVADPSTWASAIAALTRSSNSKVHGTTPLSPRRNPNNHGQILGDPDGAR